MTDVNLTTRRLALRAFDDVYRKKKSLDAAVLDISLDGDLSGSDKAFSRLLVIDSLRRLGEIDDILFRFLEKPLPSKHAFVQDVLRLSVLQIFFLKTVPYAAVSTGVELLKSYRKGAFCALANAVLRKVAAQSENIKTDELKNFPDWLIEKWQKAYGKKVSLRLAKSFLKEAPLDFSVKENPALWAEKLHGSVLPSGTVRRMESVNVSLLEGYETGDWWVQDFSASLPVKMFSALKGKRVLDVCAAPGGKTAQLCQAGALVTALDVSEKRMRRLKENMDRLSFTPQTVVADFRRWKEQNPHIRFDAVLLDAPCSATGTLRRHPDILYHRTADDVQRLCTVQRELLEAALDVLKENGELVYAVCSLLPQEGVEQADFIEQTGLAVRLPLKESVVPDEVITKKGDVLVFPDTFENVGGADGFYACRLMKRKKI